MIRPWHTARAKRAAIVAIAPLVASSRARLGCIPDATWQQPYMLGFLSMLIALVAVKHSGGGLDSNQLGLTQIGAFARITGIVDDSIGEQVCVLSAAGDGEFLSGCRNALLFLKAREGEHDPDDGDIADVCAELQRSGVAETGSPEDGASFGRGGAVAAALWQRYFDSHIPTLC
jgi:hypothetical protein